MRSLALYLSILVVSPLWATSAPDKCKNFLELKAWAQEGVDFSVTADYRFHPVTVTAVHGGNMEWGADVIAEKLARDTYNLYTFKSHRQKGDFDLHLTSSRFDDPRLLSMVENSQWVVSIHGFPRPKFHGILVGGQNTELRDLVFQSLTRSGLVDQDHHNPLGVYQGISPKNFVNKARDKGVQIELSSSLLEELMAQPHRMSQLVEAIDMALKAYIATKNSKVF